jgi:hypothetical protein
MRGIEEIPPRTSLTLEPQKTQNRAPLLTNLGGESKGKNHEGFKHTSTTKSQRESPRKYHTKIAKKGLRKSPKRRNGNNTTRP